MWRTAATGGSADLGSLGGKSTGTANWIFIPGTDCAIGTETVYYVGGFLRYTENGQELTFSLTSVAITVYPQPELYLDYFWQRDVYADDPWTEEIEPSIPFELAVMVWNQGGGVAQNLRIESAQPEIVENEKGLLIDFKIIASQVAGQNMTPSLNVDFGNINPDATSIATWLMTSTLQGQFTDLSVSFTHVNGFGNPQLSLIKEVNIHQLIHTVYADGVYDDGKPDFLVNDIPDPEDLPDTLYLSDGSIESVFIASHAKTTGTLSPTNFTVQLTFDAQPGWSYLRMTDSDPGGTLYKLVRVVRADGMEVPLQNFWQTDRTFIAGGKRPVYESNLHLLDYNCSGEYTLYYEPLDKDGPEIAEIETIPQFRETPLGSLDLIFNEPIKPGTFTRDVLTLTKDGNLRNLIDETVQIEQISGTHFRINGLSAQTQEDGEYKLTISLSGVEDIFGNRSAGNATITWLKAVDSPYIVVLGTSPGLVRMAGQPFSAMSEETASLESLSPFTQHTIDSIDLVFSKSIDAATFHSGQLILTRNGGVNLINDSVTVVNIDSTHWRISGLADLTSEEGTYELTIKPNGIRDADKNKVVGTTVAAWTKDSRPPLLLETNGIEKSHVNFAYDAISLLFDKAVDFNAESLDALTLTRNGNPIDLSGYAQLVITAGETNRWTVDGLSALTREDGIYVLTVDLSKIPDLAGNVIHEIREFSWVMDTMVPVIQVPETLIWSRTGEINLSGIVSENDVIVHVRNLSNGSSLGSMTLDTANWDYPVFIREEGFQQLLLTVMDRAGNSSEVLYSVYVDRTAPFVLDIQLEQNTGAEYLSGIVTVQFSKNTNILDLMESNTVTEVICFRSSYGIIPIPPGHFAYDPVSKRLTITLDGIVIDVPQGGLSMELVIDGSVIHDKAGNMLRGSRTDHQEYLIPVFAEAIEIYASSSPIIVDSYSVPVFADWNGDGIPDLIVGEMSNDGFGRIRVYLNSGTAEEPVFTTFFHAMSTDSELKIDAAGCLGAAPRLVDWNDNGLLDLVVGRSDGQIQVFLNIGTQENPVFAPPTFVQAGTGGNTRNLSVGARAVFDVVDWNNDGRFDLVVGGLDGKVHVFLNTSDSGTPVFETEMIVQLDGNDLVVDSGRASVFVVDLNGDGRKDLILGNTDGSIWYYPNIGTDAEPKFTSGQRIQADGVEIDLEASARSRPFVADYNNDGVLDLLVGSQDGKIRLYYGRSAIAFTSDGNPGDEFASTFYLAPTPKVEPPVTPAVLEASDITGNSVTLTWDAVSTATSYNVLRYDGSGLESDLASWEVITPLNYSQTSFIVIGLASGTYYKFRVAALNTGGESAPTETLMVRTNGAVGHYIVTTLDDLLTGVPYIKDLSLREALLLAKSGSIITFDGELFNNDGTAKADLVLQYGELVVKNSVQIVGHGVTIDAHGASRVFNINSGKNGCEVELVGLTLTGGVTSTQGGALYAKNAQLTLADVTFVGNTANYGGAVYFVDSTVVMMDCTMTGNNAKWGGAIYQNGGTLTSNGSNTITNNSATWGGAIYQADGKLSLDDVTISENQSTYGGGLYQAKGEATLTANTKISGNTANRNFGSAIVKAKGAALTINSNVLNQALSLYLDEIESFL